MNAVAKPAVPFEIVKTKLGADDDPLLWQTVLSVLGDEFIQRHKSVAKNKDWAFVVGACSHWVRPHNSGWTPSRGFVVPEGYKDSMPEFNWSVTLVFRGQKWIAAAKLPGKRTTLFRVAIPVRTVRHKHAAVHTRWTPGHETVFYEFRNLNGKWQCVAASDERSKGRILAES